jgi:hypothetical protein
LTWLAKFGTSKIQIDTEVGMSLKLSRLLVVLVGLGLVAGRYSPGLVGIASLGAPLTPAIVGPSSCYTWDFLNNTGQDATGLVIHLKGIPALTDEYTGVLNPFGPSTSSYDAGTGVLSLVYSGGTASAGDMVQIGICASQAALRLDTALPAFYWVVTGAPADPAPLFAGLDFNWVDPNHLQVHLYNEQSITLTVISFSAFIPPASLSLDDLNNGVASTLSMVSDQIASPTDMPGASSQTFDILFNQGEVRVPQGAPVVLEATLSAQDDQSNLIHLFVQTTQPFAEMFLPVMRK